MLNQIVAKAIQNNPDVMRGIVRQAIKQELRQAGLSTEPGTRNDFKGAVFVNADGSLEVRVWGIDEKLIKGVRI